MEIFFCVITLVGHSFFAVLTLSEQLDSDKYSVAVAAVAAVIPFLLYSLSLYDFGNVSSQMTSQALRVCKSLESIAGLGFGADIGHKVCCNDVNLQISGSRFTTLAVIRR